MEEAYRQARKRGEQGRRRAISQSEHPYLTDLDSLVAQLPLGQRERRPAGYSARNGRRHGYQGPSVCLFVQLYAPVAI